MIKGLWSSEDLIQYTSMFLSVRMSCLNFLLLHVYKFSLIPLELQYNAFTFLYIIKNNVKVIVFVF